MAQATERVLLGPLGTDLLLEALTTTIVLRCELGAMTRGAVAIRLGGTLHEGREQHGARDIRQGRGPCNFREARKRPTWLLAGSGRGPSARPLAHKSPSDNAGRATASETDGPADFRRQPEMRMAAVSAASASRA
jgi:hypothetical protein